MKTTFFAGVAMPATNYLKLLNRVKTLVPSTKTTLYFFYSEFLIRASRNSSYREVLNRGVISAIDGKGLEWANWSKSKIKNTYINKPNKVLIYFKFGYFLIINLILGLITIIFKHNFSKRTGNQVILGRDFTFDILQVAATKKWKTLIIGGSHAVQSKLQDHYPSLSLDSWYQPFDCNLMRDQPESDLRIANNIVAKHQMLNSDNLLQVFPTLNEVVKRIRNSNFDLILVCIGGASGKQEFLIDYLQKDSKCNFTLAVGVGAALDHLGGGIKQPRTSIILEKVGLEWLHRLITQPYRRARILDSILGLWIRTSWEMAGGE